MKITKKHLQNRVKWIAALRSGKYKQAFGALRRNDTSFCVMGLGLELCKLNLVRWYYCSIFPDKMRSTICNAYKLSVSDMATLMTMNDFDKDSFIVLADAIEYITRADASESKLRYPS